jgi:lipopolysaccharide export system permease protein
MFFGTWLMLTSMVFVYEVTNSMKYFISSKGASLHATSYLLYSIPHTSLQVIAPGLMFSVCFVIGQFSSHKELVSMMAAGISFRRIIKPIVIFGIGIWFMQMILAETVVAWTNKESQFHYSFLEKGMGKVKDMVLQYHVRGKEGFYFVYYYDAGEKSIRGGFHYFKMNDEGMPSMSISAKKAIYSPDKNNWKLLEVEEMHYDQNLRLVQTSHFPEQEYTFPESIEYFSKPIQKTAEMNLAELGDEIERRKQKGIPFRDIQAERYARFAEPLMSLIVLLIGALAGALTKKSAGVASLGITIGVVLSYYIVYSTSRTLGENGGIPVWLGVWFPAFLYLTGTFAFYRKLNL